MTAGRSVAEPAPDEIAALALQALVWTIGDPARADRMLALTGLTPQSLRLRADDPALLAAVIGFLMAHEPDLIACATAIGTTPAMLAHARGVLEA